MKYCNQCGAAVELKIPQGDHLPRHVCKQCGTIHYQNPKIVSGCIARWQSRILLCKRAIEPRYGLWTLPAGFMENGETTLEAAARESWEEAHARLENTRLFAIFNLPHINQVYTMFQANLKAGQASPGAESLEVDLFDEQDIPWNELAFPVIETSLKLYYNDRRHDADKVHFGDIFKLDNGEFKTHMHD